MRSHRKPLEAVPAPAPKLRLVPPLEGVELPSYTAEDGECVKCGADFAKVEFLASGQTCTHVHGSGWKAMWGQERLHRTCRDCGYSWDEAVIGNKEPKDADS